MGFNNRKRRIGELVNLEVRFAVCDVTDDIMDEQNTQQISTNVRQYISNNLFAALLHRSDDMTALLEGATYKDKPWLE